MTFDPKYPYHIYVLDHDCLRYTQTLLDAANSESIYLGDNPELGTIAEARSLLETYKSLLSNGPRSDESIRALYGVQAITLQEAINKELSEEKSSTKSLLKRKCIAAMDLYDLGYYQKLAMVSAECADDAFALTNGQVIPYWREVKSKDYVLCNSELRNASSYDLIFRFGKPFLKMSLGYLDISEGYYSDELV